MFEWWKWGVRPCGHPAREGCVSINAFNKCSSKHFSYERYDMPIALDFCPTCDNVLAISQAGERVFHRCDCCNREVDLKVFDGKSRCMMRTFYKSNASKGGVGGSDSSASQNAATDRLKDRMSEAVLQDPTLPTTQVAVCPSPSCSHATGNVAYMKIDAVDLLFLYACRDCGHKWTSQLR
jgi:DNA-directed RNA polymerase subunit M/transcription elongation factor TFIIS